jgi:hypothetical protein
MRVHLQRQSRHINQSVLFGSMLLESAWNSLTPAERTPAPADLCSQLLSNLALLRAAARGESTSVRALIAFTGMTVESGVTVKTPWGELRPLTPAERTLAPPLLDGAVSGTDPEGNQITVSYAGELVLDTTIPYELVVEPIDRGAGAPRPWPKRANRNELGHRIEAIQLSALLAIPRPTGSQVIARLAWTWIEDPLSFGRQMGWSDTKSAPGFMPYALRANDSEAIGHFCRQVDQHRPRTIDIAVRRIISAAQARAEPADRLVDAVIAWENLFGPTEGEPRLRISAAMAWLLGESAASRESLQQRLKIIYDARSGIVHGGTVDLAALNDQAGDALQFAIQSLATMFSDRTDLLKLPDGAARSIRLILDTNR